MKARKIFLLIIVLVEWFALIAQFLLQQQEAQRLGLAESLARFFTYFTVLTNILVAVYVSNQFFIGDKRKNNFFSRPGVQTAITLYIVVVGLVYNLVLRQLWTSGGLQAILHDLLHSVAPLLILIYWWRWVDAKNLQYKNISAWLIYPAVYTVIILIRGYFSTWYPYPFMDVIKLGYLKVIINSSLVTLTFLLFAYLLVFLGRRKAV